MIKLTNLEKIYRTKEIETVALENVNLDIRKGEFLSIMGPSDRRYGGNCRYGYEPYERQATGSFP